MLFPTVRFAIFFSIVLPLSWLLMRRRGTWKAFILAASYFFYSFANWDYVFLLAGSTVVNQWFAHLIDRGRGQAGRRGWLALAVVFNLGLLAYFKYYDFLASSANNLFADLGVDAHIPLYNIILPAAISFFTFQALSYVIDTFRGKIRPSGIADFAVYLSFFPHLIAGPIVRAAEFLPQLKTKRDPRDVDAGLGFWLIASGLFKKVVISSYVASTIVNPVFKAPNQHLAFDTLLGIYGYAVQIYMDFSGYTDMAIGLALLLGFRFPQNFDAPYSAVSLQDFWRRWHMTLSRWLRDYLYIPLGGNRHGKAIGYCNLMATMILGGMWHGAGWLFFIWGAIHGVYQAIERFIMDLFKARRAKHDQRMEAKRKALEALTAVPGLIGDGSASGDRHHRLPGVFDQDAAAPGRSFGPGDGVRKPALVGTAASPGDSGQVRIAAPVATTRPTEAAPALTPRAARSPRPGSSLVGRWVRRIITFNVVCSAWVFFKVGYDEGSLEDAIAVFKRLGHWGSAIPFNPVLVAVIVGSLAAQFIPADWSGRVRAAFSRLHWAVQGVSLSGWMVICSVFGPIGISPFIYFKF